MHIRLAEDSDLPRLQEIYYHSRSQHFSWVDRTQLALEDFDSDTDGEVIWVVDGKRRQVAGFISVWVPEHFIHNLFVAPEMISKGYGSALLRHGLKHIGRPARLKCSKENHTALSFYHSHRWRILREGTGVDGPYYKLEFNEDI